MGNTISSTVDSFLNDWSKLHDGRQPIGWLLRQDSALPWVRFHSLPDSKRYAETDSEMDTVLARGNTLAGELFGMSPECWMICARWDDIVGPGELAGSWIEDGGDPYAKVWKFFVQRSTWTKGKFDNELEELADDAPHYMVWFNPKRGRIFAPYDGGFDLFSSSQEEIADLKSRYSDWLSDHEDGL